VTGAVTVAVTGVVTVTGAVAVTVTVWEIVLVIPIQVLFPHHHTPKGPGCAPDVPYDEPDRPKGPF